MTSKFAKRKRNGPPTRHSNPRLMALLFQATRLFEDTKLRKEDLNPEEYAQIVNLHELAQEALEKLKARPTRRTRRRS